MTTRWLLVPPTGTRCETQLRAFERLNRRMQGEARDTFAEFEASIGRDSARHLVSALDDFLLIFFYFFLCNHVMTVPRRVTPLPSSRRPSIATPRATWCGSFWFISSHPVTRCVPPEPFMDKSGCCAGLLAAAGFWLLQG